MKENPLKYFIKYSIILGLILPLVSCSLFSNRVQVSDDEGAVSEPIKTVPKPQYDQLLAKYESLLRSTRKGSETSETKEVSHADIPPSLMVDKDAPRRRRTSVLAETVEVFGKNGIVKEEPVVPTGLSVIDSSRSMPIITGNVSEESVNNNVLKVQKAIRFIGLNKFDNALVLLRDLEFYPVKQIRVRAKYYLGEILFLQNEYDLAMQKFEEVLNEYSFSGLVLKSLGRLIVCSEKLKLEKKKEQYYSLLHDIFNK